ncbi:DNA damage response exodeoxyribonuclease YhbQ [Marinobacter nanhaiticus D15-8W]|uniref:GIY-YIG nuclease family protein n=1 Tax=Marinobacter nanhaiticus D15-8W TaxID=626887 RepID=N6WWJ2_9GAMM|nr:GIY-YIG nuclease family protein [Marinobacter nanhaiticus]ENO13173.1 GIY-YIG nuclease family protein [Marinobacter nanhaiticus D15-8W]BES70533.1 DNA damage response exodeoxyribonuclease YhbQ [Marinobacter nanhaiticus D15-8W]
MTPWFLYLIRTRSGTLYTGITTDVQRRFSEHQSGGPRAARSLRGKGPLELAYAAKVGDRTRAAQLEYALKRWPRTRKERLVAGKIHLDDIEP